jgi:Sulfotransferase family
MPQLDRVHSINALGAYECFHLLERSFVSPTFGLYANVPTYTEWIESEYLKADTQAPLNLYQYYYKQIQLIKNLRNRRISDTQVINPDLEKHWVFKSPVHLWSLGHISNTIPDTRFIHIHRDPLEVIPSICSFIALGRAVLSDQVDLQKIGKQALNRWSDATNRALSIRQKNSSLRVVDIHYKRFISDPIETIRKIYSQFDYDFKPELEESLEVYISKSRKSRQGKQHKYSLQQFGLEEGEVLEVFRNYYQFMDSI